MTPIEQFAAASHEAMLERLRAGEARGWGVSWRDGSYSDEANVARLERAVEHLRHVVSLWPTGTIGDDELAKRAADVANQAFMLADPMRLRAASPEGDKR